jgi:hypothetical protein
MRNPARYADVETCSAHTSPEPNGPPLIATAERGKYTLRVCSARKCGRIAQLGERKLSFARTFFGRVFHVLIPIPRLS